MSNEIVPIEEGKDVQSLAPDRMPNGEVESVVSSLEREFGFVSVSRANGASSSRRLSLEGESLPHKLVVSVEPDSGKEGSFVWVSLSVYSPSNPALELRPTRVEATQALALLRSHVQVAKLPDTAIRGGVSDVLQGSDVASQ